MKNLVVYSLLGMVIASYFSFGFFHLTKYVTTDEQFWIYDRIPRYWKGLLKMKPKQTHINDKPGVALAIFSGAGLLFADPAAHKIQTEKTYDAYNTDLTGKIYRSFRLPLLILNGALIIYLFWAIKKISNQWIALWSSAFIALSPVLLGISRIVNPDAVFWSFSAAAIFSYLALLKTEEKKFILFTAFFTGLALLSKYVANILWVFFFVSFLGFAAFNFRENPGFSSWIKKQAENLGIIFLGSIVLFCLLMPSVFLKPNQLIEGTVGFSGIKPFAAPMALAILALWLDARFLGGRLAFGFLGLIQPRRKIIFGLLFAFTLFLFFFTAFNWMASEKLVDLSRVPIDARSSEVFTVETNLAEKALLETYPFVFSLTPLVLFLVIVFLFKKVLFPKKENTELDFFSFLMCSFILIFLAGAIFSKLLLTPRYMVMLFPLAGFLAASGLYGFFEKNIPKKNYLPYVISGAVILASVFSLWKASPFYYNYASSLLPAKYVLSNAWGFGGYEAAMYLNSLPGIENKTVWSDYRGVCEFSKAKCIIHRKFDKDKYPIDYYALTRRGQSRTDFSLINKFEKKGVKPEWEFFIGGRPGNYVKIFKNES